MDKRRRLNKLQALDRKVTNEGQELQVHELLDGYFKERERTLANEAGVCSKCRMRSGWLACDPGKLTAYWMRKEVGIERMLLRDELFD